MMLIVMAVVVMVMMKTMDAVLGLNVYVFSAYELQPQLLFVRSGAL